MRRILLETLCGLAVLVVLASFHNKIANLKIQRTEFAELQVKFEDAIANSSSKEELEALRSTVLANLEAKITSLEGDLAQAQDTRSVTAYLKRELEATRRQAALFEAQLKQDLSRTRENVATYQALITSRQDRESKSLKETRDDLANLQGRVRQDSSTLSKELLAPAVQLSGNDTVGSGTIIYSGQNPATKKTETYVITSYHVIRNIFADTPQAKQEGIDVTIYGAHNGKDRREVKADMLNYDSRIDAAILLIRGEEKFETVARVISQDRANEIEVWDPVYAVGCPLGNDPIPTRGEVSSLNNKLNGANYWMINAPTYFGNSGGGVFAADTRELCGIFSKIYTHGRGNAVVVPHMGLFTPMPLIYEWLEEEKMAFVLSNSTLPGPMTRITDAARPIK